MRHIFAASGLLAAGLMLFSVPASAGIFGKSFGERAEAVKAQIEGKHDYHAYLAKELLIIADDERAQHDRVDCQFLKLAEEAAAKAGGK